MAATTMPAIYDAVQALVVAEPYRFVPALEPFSFDLQPETKLDEVFRVEASLVASDGYFGGGASAELWDVAVWWARKIKRDAVGTYRQCLVDATSLHATVIGAGVALDFAVSDDEMSASVQQPGPEASYVVGMVRVRVDFDRALR